MLGSALVAVSLLLATHGDEGSREEKFRGALLAQNAAVAPTANDTANATANDTVNGTAALRREIALLTIERPTFTAPAVILIVGGGLAVVGGVFLLAGVAVSGWGGVGLVFLGAIGLAVAGVTAVVGLIVLAVVASVREHTDERLRTLNEQLKAASPPEPPPPPAPIPAVEWLPRARPSLVLARF